MSLGDKHLTDGTEDPKERAPLLSLFLAYAAMLPTAAARRCEAPRCFARLRPAQLLIPVASLGLLLLCDRRLSRGRDGRE